MIVRTRTITLGDIVNGDRANNRFNGYSPAVDGEVNRYTFQNMPWPTSTSRPLIYVNGMGTTGSVHRDTVGILCLMSHAVVHGVYNEMAPARLPGALGRAESMFRDVGQCIDDAVGIQSGVSHSTNAATTALARLLRKFCEKLTRYDRGSQPGQSDYFCCSPHHKPAGLPCQEISCDPAKIRR